MHEHGGHDEVLWTRARQADWYAPALSLCIVIIRVSKYDGRDAKSSKSLPWLEGLVIVGVKEPRTVNAKRKVAEDQRRQVAGCYERHPNRVSFIGLQAALPPPSEPFLVDRLQCIERENISKEHNA